MKQPYASAGTPESLAKKEQASSRPLLVRPARYWLFRLFSLHLPGKPLNETTCLKPTIYLSKEHG